MFQQLRSTSLRWFGGALHVGHYSDLIGTRCVVKKALLPLTVKSLGSNIVVNNLRMFGSSDESSKSSGPSGKRRKGGRDGMWRMGRFTGNTSQSSKDVEIHPGFQAFEDTQVKEGNQPVFGRAWTAPELRQKSWTDLHKLWFVLYKERNMLQTALADARRRESPMHGHERRLLVRKSMRAIRQVIEERETYHSNILAKKKFDEMVLDARPVTQQGLHGTRAPTASGARMVQDEGYFIGVLRQKIKDITQEVQLLKSEAMQLTRESDIFRGLHKSHEVLFEEVKQLRGQLADSNLAMDKCRTSTADPKEQRNSEIAGKVDEMFLHRRQREREIIDLKSEIENCREGLLQNIVPSAPNLVIEYEDLLKCHYNLEEEARMGDEKLEKVKNQIRQLKLTLQLRGNGYGEDHIELNSQILQLREEANTLSQDLAVVKMEPEQARKALLCRTKAKQEHCQEVERRANKTRQDISSLKIRLDGLVAMNQGHNGRISAEIVPITPLKSHQGMEKLDDLTQKNKFKTKKTLSLSTVTETSLQAQKAQSMAELEIKSLNREIQQELGMILKMREELNSNVRIYRDLDTLQHSAEKTRSHLEGLRDLYIKRRDTMQAQAQVESQLHETLKKHIAASDVTVELARLEETIRSYETKIFSLQENIKMWVTDVDFRTLQGNCKAMAEHINSIIKKCVAAR